MTSAAIALWVVTTLVGGLALWGAWVGWSMAREHRRQASQALRRRIDIEARLDAEEAVRMAMAAPIERKPR